VDHHDEPIEELARLLDLHALYFERPMEADVLSVDGEGEADLRAMLERLGRIEPAQDVWDALSGYMGWVNLEERWVGRGRIDPRVLDHLRRDAASLP
jgi:uncharacterized Ntn-hydrolase superfamily protein